MEKSTGPVCRRVAGHRSLVDRRASVQASVLIDRLAATIPDGYASKAQLQTLQRRVKAWRSERVKEMVLGSLSKSRAVPVET